MHVNIVIHKLLHYIISFRAGGNVYWFHHFRADGKSLASLVLAGPVFSQGEKIEIHFYKKQVVKKSASVISWTC